LTAGDPLVVAAIVVAALEKTRIRYVIGGSLASVTHGEPRSTLDVDIAVDLSNGTVDAFVHELESEFFVDLTWARQEVRRRGSFQAVHRESMVRVDLFVPEWTGFHLWKWEHRRQLAMNLGAVTQMDMTGPEAIILQKLDWFEHGGRVSDRQWRDVIGVLKAQTNRLDLASLRSWSNRMDLTDLLEKALQESGIQA
jgi:hypothetical protein